MKNSRPQKIVFLGMPRSGSNFVCTAIDNHPEFVVHGELFMPRRVGALRGEFQRNPDAKEKLSSVAYRDQNPREFLEKVLSFDPSKRFVGFKLFFSHHPEILDFVLSPEAGFKKIHINRENILAMFSSREIVKKTKQAHINLSRKNELRQEQVDFSKKKFMKYLDEYEHYARGRIQEMQRQDDCLEVTYEEFRKGEGFQRVFKYLGADPELHFWTRMIKRNTDSIIDRFTNPEEVRQCLKELGHEEWANEGLR
jgi:hypothetical protein